MSEYREELKRLLTAPVDFDNPHFQIGFLTERCASLEKLALRLIEEIEHLQGEMENRINE